MAAKDEDNLSTVHSVEIKTITAVRTIEEASALGEQCSANTSLEIVGTDEKSSELFRELEPSTHYRGKVPQHCATQLMNPVEVFVGTGGSMVEGNIIYTCLIAFAGSRRYSYTY